MRRRRMPVAVVAAVVVAAIALWNTGWGPFGSSLDRDEQAVVDEVDARTHATRPVEARRFVEDNIDVLLSEDVARHVDRDAHAELFEVALSSQQGDDDQVVLAMVVAAVAEPGAIHNDALRPVFGDATAARMEWFDTRINASLRVTPDAATDEARHGIRAARSFVLETMHDPQTAARLHEAVYDYGLAEVASAPEGGDGRASRLDEIGRVQAFFEAAQTDAGTGDAGSAGGSGRRESSTDRAVWVALDRLGFDPAARAAAAGQPFVDANGAPKTELGPSERDALALWAVSQAQSGGPCGRTCRSSRAVLPIFSRSRTGWSILPQVSRRTAAPSVRGGARDA